MTNNLYLDIALVIANLLFLAVIAAFLFGFVTSE